MIPLHPPLSAAPTQRRPEYAGHYQQPFHNGAITYRSPCDVCGHDTEWRVIAPTGPSARNVYEIQCTHKENQ